MLRSIVAPIQKRLRIRNWPVLRPYFLAGLLSTGIYASLALLVCMLPALQVVGNLVILLIVAQFWGMLLTWLFETKLFQGHSLQKRSLLVVALVIWGMLLFVGLGKKAGAEAVYLGLYLPATVLVALPWFGWRALNALADVPTLRYAPLTFESLKDILGEMQFTNPSTGLRWVFEADFFELDASGSYVFRTFSPDDVTQLPLGKLFKGVIALHNINEVPQRPITFQADQHMRCLWEFYDYPYWWWPTRKRFLHPNKPLRKNGVRFLPISAEERQRSTIKLLPKFRAARIYVRRWQAPE